MNKGQCVVVMSIALAGGLGAACGGGQTNEPGAQAPAAPAPSPSSIPSPDAGAPLVQTAPEQEFHGPMTPIAASTFIADVVALGLDPKALPPLSKMDPKLLRKIMPSFAKSLGVKCIGCHIPDNFGAPTPRKKIAEQMWDHFVVQLSMKDGSPLYCDSCHQGRTKMIDRSDKKALSKWMDENYVGKLARRDKAEHECATCHDDPFEPDIFGKIWHSE